MFPIESSAYMLLGIRLVGLAQYSLDINVGVMARVLISMFWSHLQSAERRRRSGSVPIYSTPSGPAIPMRA